MLTTVIPDSGLQPSYAARSAIKATAELLVSGWISIRSISRTRATLEK